jgi:hypothetical protein
VVTCEEGNLKHLTLYPLPLQTPGYRGRVPWANLPKQKEPPHRGDIGWGRFLLCQFVLYPLACDLKYKLRDNKDNFSGEATHESTLWCKGFSIRASGSKGASFQWIELYLRRAHHAWAHLSLLDLCCSLRQAAIVSGSFVSCTCCIPPSIFHI